MNYTLNSRVDIEVGLSRPVSRREMLPRICVVGVVPMNAPVIAEQSPYALIRKSDYAPNFPYIEQVRLSSVQQTVLLPGVGNRWPSRLRDCLSGLIARTDGNVDVVGAMVAFGWCRYLVSHSCMVLVAIPRYNRDQ